MRKWILSRIRMSSSLSLSCHQGLNANVTCDPLYLKCNNCLLSGLGGMGMGTGWIEIEMETGWELAVSNKRWKFS
jgi:hypothetical protein